MTGAIKTTNKIFTITQAQSIIENKLKTKLPIDWINMPKKAFFVSSDELADIINNFNGFIYQQFIYWEPPSKEINPFVTQSHIKNIPANTDQISQDTVALILRSWDENVPRTLANAEIPYGILYIIKN